MGNKKKITLSDEQLELASKLTVLQRKFVLELIKPGVTQRQAYLTAGGSGKTEESQDNSASKMFSHVQVRAFYDSLLSAAATAAILDMNQALTIVSDIANDPEVAPNHRVGAVKQAADMLGWNAPKKTELSGEDGVIKIHNTWNVHPTTTKDT